MLSGNYNGVFHFQGVVLISVSSQVSWVRRGRGLNDNFGIKFYKLQIKSSNNWLATCYLQDG